MGKNTSPHIDKCGMHIRPKSNLNIESLVRCRIFLSYSKNRKYIYWNHFQVCHNKIKMNKKRESSHTTYMHMQSVCIKQKSAPAKFT